MTTRGVPEVPRTNDWNQLRRHLEDMRAVVIKLRENQAPPSLPSNFKVTPQAFGNLLSWTRSINADFFEILWSPTAKLSQATLISVGNSQQWTDQIGQTGIKRFYWIRAAKNSGARSVEVGPIAGTSLASNTGVNPPVPPPPAQRTVLDQTRNYPVTIGARSEQL